MGPGLPTLSIHPMFILIGGPQLSRPRPSSSSPGRGGLGCSPPKPPSSSCCSLSSEAEVPAGAVAILLEEAAGHGLDVDLVGAVVDAPEPRRPVHLLERQVGGEALGPED